jgi:hypothetical protein
MEHESDSRREPWRRYAGLLAENGLEDESVEQLMAAVSRVAELNFPLRVFPIGIPAWDGLGVQVQWNVADLNALTAVLQDALLKNVVIFPLGIPNPEVFQATFNFG